MLSRGQFWLAVLLVLIGVAAMDYLIHAVMLASDYAAIPAMWRPEHEVPQYLPFRIAGWVAFAVAFVWTYAKGMSMLGATGQGLRFGLAIAAMCVIARHLVWFPVAPYPLPLVLKWIGLETLEYLILALIVANVAASRKALP